MNPLAYLGSMFTEGEPVEIIKKERAPTKSDRSFEAGQMWLDTSAAQVYMFTGLVGIDAVWEVVDNPKSNYRGEVAPTVNDDSDDGYGVGSTWVDTVADLYYICVDATVGAAVWQNLSAAGGSGIPTIGTSTDNALVRWDGASGDMVQNSNATLSDAGVLSLGTPLAVGSGGTGASTLTSGGILLGNGASAVQATGQPTNGQLIIGSTGVAPVLGTLTAGANVSIVNGAGTITISAANPGSGDVVGPASSTDNAIARYDGLTGKLVQNSVVAVSDTGDFSGVNNMTVGGAFVLTSDQVQVSEGGTGAASFTSNALLLGNGTSAISSAAALSNGQLLIGSFGNAPVAANLTAGSNISIVNSAGGITISSSAAGGLTYNAVAGTTQAMVADNAYQNDNAALTTFSLPATAAKGTRLEIIGYGTGGWLMSQAVGQSVIVGNMQTTIGAGGSLASTNRFDNVELVCVVANTTWKVVDMQGNIDII